MKSRRDKTTLFQACTEFSDVSGIVLFADGPDAGLFIAAGRAPASLLAHLPHCLHGCPGLLSLSSSPGGSGAAS